VNDLSKVAINADGTPKVSDSDIDLRKQATILTQEEDIQNLLNAMREVFENPQATHDQQREILNQAQDVQLHLTAIAPELSRYFGSIILQYQNYHRDSIRRAEQEQPNPQMEALQQTLAGMAATNEALQASIQILANRLQMLEPHAPVAPPAPEVPAVAEEREEVEQPAQPLHQLNAVELGIDPVLIARLNQAIGGPVDDAAYSELQEVVSGNVEGMLGLTNQQARDVIGALLPNRRDEIFTHQGRIRGMSQASTRDLRRLVVFVLLDPPQINQDWVDYLHSLTYHPNF